MKLKLPPVLLVNQTIDGNSVRQISTPLSEIEATIAKFTVEGGTGWMFSPTDGSEPIHLFEKVLRKPIDSATARVLLGEAPSMSDEYDARNARWLQHPDFASRTTRPIPKDVTNSWLRAFNFISEDTEQNIVGLRAPQIGALHAIHAHWSTDSEVATVVMPTGTGKTETMLATLISAQCRRILVVVPTDALRTQIFNKFLTLGILKAEHCKVLAPSTKFPIVGMLNHKPKSLEALDHFFEICNVIVTTSSIAGQSPQEIQARMAFQCSHLFIDEAHHAEAPTWKSFKLNFSGKFILQFTATPFREDDKLIDGKIIYKYPLKKAQQEGYFQPIQFSSVFEFSPALADRKIADQTIEELKKDLTGLHIAMARVSSIERAVEVHKIYSSMGQFNPVLLHSKTKTQDRNEALASLTSGKSRLVVCVDMLGEGFDMPELKIAAFHDIKKSLAVTLQLAGRFTRTRKDLGQAIFIANIANIEVQSELRKLYTQDPDWNALLPELSETAITDEMVSREFLSGFADFPAEMPLKDLRPAASAVIYRTNCANWDPKKFKKGLRGIGEFQHVYHSINEVASTLVVAVGSGQPVEWADLESLRNWSWELYVAIWDRDLQLLFIHGSGKKGEYKALARALCGADVELVVDPELYRCFSGIKRLLLNNVGMNEHFGRNVRYIGRMGADVGSGLSDASKQNARKAVLGGFGYENGATATLGAAKRGRVWSFQRLRLDSFSTWCKTIGRKVIDDEIDPDEVLKGTLKVAAITVRPPVMPIAIDWPESMFTDLESFYTFHFSNGHTVQLHDIGIELIKPSESGSFRFRIFTETFEAKFKLELSEDTQEVTDYRFISEGSRLLIKRRDSEYDACDFFEENPPVIWLADGSSLEGNQLISLQSDQHGFDSQKIKTWDWSGTDLRKEAQGVTAEADSIQFRAIENLIRTETYDLIFDDDGPGEAADIVAIKVKEKGTRSVIEVDFFHCKFSLGNPGARVDDLYAVCGQAQKSVSWLHGHNRRTDLFAHLLKRDPKILNGVKSSRYQLGNQKRLGELRDLSRISDVKLSIYLVQPGLSKAKVSAAQLALLSVTEKYLLETYQVPFEVIASE